jgi:hypothetical protein
MDSITVAYLKKHRLPPFENWEPNNASSQPTKTISNLLTVENAINSANEEIYARQAREHAQNAAGVYRGELSKYVNRWKDLSEMGAQPWALHRLLSPPQALPRETQDLLGLPYSPR